MKGYRTVVVNILTACVIILALPEVTNIIPHEAAPYLVAAQAIINVVMRVITTTPIGKSEDE